MPMHIDDCQVDDGGRSGGKRRMLLSGQREGVKVLCEKTKQLGKG